MSYGRIERGPMGADVVGSNFTQVYNDAVRDGRLSWKARGLLLWILSHKEGFGISVASLVAAAPDGEKSVYSGLKELETFKYLQRSQKQDPETKQWTAMVYRVTDIPNGATIHIPSPWADEEKPSSEPLPPKGGAAKTDEEGDVPISGDRPYRRAGKGDAGNAVHKKTTFEEDQAPSEQEDSLSSVSSTADAGKAAPEAPEREVASLDKPGPEQIVDSYRKGAAAAKKRPAKSSLQEVRSQAQALCSEDSSPELLKHLCVLASDLGKKGWSDLEKHLEKNPVRQVQVLSSDIDDRWPLHKCPHCHGSSWRNNPERPGEQTNCDHSKSRPVYEPELTLEEKQRLEDFMLRQKQRREANGC